MINYLVDIDDGILPLIACLAADVRLIRVVPTEFNPIDLLAINFNLKFLAIPLAHLP